MGRSVDDMGRPAVAMGRPGCDTGRSAFAMGRSALPYGASGRSLWANRRLLRCRGVEARGASTEYTRVRENKFVPGMPEKNHTVSPFNILIHERIQRRLAQGGFYRARSPPKRTASRIGHCGALWSIAAARALAPPTSLAVERAHTPRTMPRSQMWRDNSAGEHAVMLRDCTASAPAPPL
jgi:hypothetical protein